MFTSIGQKQNSMTMSISNSQMSIVPLVALFNFVLQRNLTQQHPSVWHKFVIQIVILCN